MASRSSLRRSGMVAGGILILIVLVIAILAATHWPFSSAKVIQNFQETFPATVTFQSFRSTYFPHPGCVAENIVFRRLGTSPDTPPIVTVQRMTIQAQYLDFLFRPHHLSRIVLEGFHVHIPPMGTTVRDTGWRETPSKIMVSEVVADHSLVEIARADSDPLRFEIHAGSLKDVTRNSALSYSVKVHNPLPPGEIVSSGHFGPWNSDAPGQTPFSGSYTFHDADLSVFHGIAGMLSSNDSFQGTLGRIEANGSVDIPDFMLTHTKHAIHLSSQFHAFIDGTDGNVALERVTSRFLNTRVISKGDITGRPGQPGKIASIDFYVRDGRIQDVLRMFASAPKPGLNGATNFRAHVILPPQGGTFLQRVRLSGDFGINDAQFTKATTQAGVDSLSERARGEKPAKADEPDDKDNVISNLAGRVELRNAVAHFSDLSFHVPGATANMNGTYNLESRVIDLHGDLKTDAEFSQMTSGFKSVLLKPFNVFYKRKNHQGADLPVHLIGTYEHPDPGLDIVGKKQPEKDAAGQQGPADKSSAPKSSASKSSADKSGSDKSAKK